MNVVRKTIALIIIVFIGIPTLVGIIWAVGITRAVVSPEFLSELPREIIEKVPNMLDEVVEEVDREYVITDKETRLWVRALASADTSPKELLEEIGVMEWMHTELSHSLEDVGKILKGEMRPRTVMLNLRPLKTALKHEKINEYLKEVIDKLPPCTDEQKEEWIAAVMDADSLEDLPPCRPQDLDEAVKILRNHWIREVEDIPDEVEMFKIERGWYFKDSTADIIQLVMSLTFFLFFLPAVILAAGALIATSSGPGILRWLGFSTLAGGILSFGLSSFTVRFLGWGIGAFPFSYSYTDVPPLAEAFIEKSSDIFLTVVDHLFSAVNVVSGVVCIVGIVLIALSYSMVREAKPGPGKKPQTTEPRPVSPTPPAPEISPTPQTTEETKTDTEIDKEKDSPSEVSTPDTETREPGA